MAELNLEKGDPCRESGCPGRMRRTSTKRGEGWARRYLRCDYCGASGGCEIVPNENVPRRASRTKDYENSGQSVCESAATSHDVVVGSTNIQPNGNNGSTNKGDAMLLDALFEFISDVDLAAALWPSMSPNRRDLLLMQLRVEGRIPGPLCVFDGEKLVEVGYPRRAIEEWLKAGCPIFDQVAWESYCNSDGGKREQFFCHECN